MKKRMEGRLSEGEGEHVDTMSVQRPADDVQSRSATRLIRDASGEGVVLLRKMVLVVLSEERRLVFESSESFPSASPLDSSPLPGDTKRCTRTRRFLLAVAVAVTRPGLEERVVGRLWITDGARNCQLRLATMEMAVEEGSGSVSVSVSEVVAAAAAGCAAGVSCENGKDSAARAALRHAFGNDSDAVGWAFTRLGMGLIGRPLQRRLYSLDNESEPGLELDDETEVSNAASPRVRFGAWTKFFEPLVGGGGESVSGDC
jgi:hypothetical protein